MPDKQVEVDDNAKAFDKLLAGEIFTSTDIQMNLEILCDDLGSRFAGTPAEAEAAQFLRTTLEQYRLKDVHNEAFEYNGWTRGSAKLTMTAPWQRELPCLSMPMSPSGRCSGKIIDLGTGSPETFDTLQAELKGNIALVNITNPASAGRGCIAPNDTTDQSLQVPKRLSSWQIWTAMVRLPVR